MSEREKKILFIFGVAGFLILNLFVYSFAKSKRNEVDAQSRVAKDKLHNVEIFRASREQISDEMDWLASHEPEPAANQDVQTKLQQFAENEAKSTGLTIKTQKPLPTSTDGAIYHRAKIQMNLTGTEEALYRWFDKLNVPDQFRIASQIRLSPNTTDDTKIDCLATIEQWFIPKTP